MADNSTGSVFTDQLSLRNLNANATGGKTALGISPTAITIPAPQDTPTSTASYNPPKLIDYGAWINSQQQNGNFSSGNTQSSNGGVSSGASQLLSSAGKQFLPGITSSINNFGMGLGFGSGGGASEAISSSLAAADPSLVASGASISEGAASAGALTSASLTGVLSAAALGYMGGGILAGALGENPTGGSIGGGLGAGIGFAVAGPLGALVGGIGGSIFGGMFGNSSMPTNATGGGSDFTASGKLVNPNSQSKNPNAQSTGYLSTTQSDFSNLAQAASTALGIKFDPGLRLNSNFSSLHGGGNIEVSTQDSPGHHPFDTGQINLDLSNNDSKNAAYLQALQGAAKESGFTDPQKITDWFNNVYSKGGGSLSGTAPTLPNNPKASQDQTDWQTFINNYKAQQNANAAPTPTS